MSCHVMSCHVMSCHVMSCHVMSCHVMSCHVMFTDELHSSQNAHPVALRPQTRAAALRSWRLWFRFAETKRSYRTIPCHLMARQSVSGHITTYSRMPHHSRSLSRSLSLSIYIYICIYVYIYIYIYIYYRSTSRHFTNGMLRRRRLTLSYEPLLAVCYYYYYYSSSYYYLYIPSLTCVCPLP